MLLSLNRRDPIATYGAYTFEITATDADGEKGTVTGSVRVQSFDKDTCTLTFDRKVDMVTNVGDDPDAEFRDNGQAEIRIPLKEVGKTVKVSPLTSFRKVYSVGGGGQLLQIEILGKGDKKPIAIKERRRVREGGTETEKNLNDNVGATNIIVADDEIADRTKKALEHAIELCQRKKEAFSGHPAIG